MNYNDILEITKWPRVSVIDKYLLQKNPNYFYRLLATMVILTIHKDKKYSMDKWDSMINSTEKFILGIK